MSICTALEIRVTTPTPGLRTVYLRGELDLDTAPQTTAVLDHAISAEGTREITVDLSDLRFIDATGLGVLVQALRQAEKHHMSFRVHDPRGEVDMVLRLCGLADVMGVPEIPLITTDPG